MVLELTGSQSKIVYRPLPEDDPMQRRPDITKARELLGWEPTVGLRDGLMKTIDWFKKSLQISGQIFMANYKRIPIASWLQFELSLHQMSCIEQRRIARGVPNGRTHMFRVGQ